MSAKKCLNCDNELQAKYCCHCGQKADTHRITPKHFLTHDLLHGVFHIDKGILFTIKEALTRPGKAATDYIKGKRISYYNIFYLTLVVIGLNILVANLYSKYVSSEIILKGEKDGEKFIQFLEANAKYIILAFIPLFALNAMLIFKRPKFNFAEHHIISGFALLGCTIISLLDNLINFLNFNTLFENIVSIIENIITIGLFIYISFVYYYALGNYYTKLGFSWRMLAMFLLFFIEGILLLFLMLIIVSKGNFSGGLHFQ